MKKIYSRTQKNILLFILAITMIFISPVGIYNESHASPVVGFEPGRIIDDDVFTASGSMSVTDIQNFLNSKVPSCDTQGTQPSEYGGGTRAQWAANASLHPIIGAFYPPFTCLKDYKESNISTAQIIYNAAQQYQINPQVLIVLLQKEQALVTDTWPGPHQYKTATGYGCPDTAACDSQYFGLTNQINWSARMFRSILNDSPTWYTPYIMGNNYIQWNPSSSCGGSTVNISTKATQALYNYTPYQPNQASLDAGYGTGNSCSSYGNRNFYLYFTDWFGSTKGSSYFTCKDGTNLVTAETGQKILRNRLSNVADNLSLVIPNNTGTKCVETHTWANSRLQTWLQHLGTNAYTFDSTYSKAISGKISKTKTLFYKIDYTNTNSGRVEVHGWSSDVQHWNSHIATNAGPIDPSLSEIIPADTDGNGVDEFYLVNYKDTGSGKVEVHGWSKDFQKWTVHLATNLSALDPTKGRIIAGDINGDGRDEFTYVKFADTQSGYIEFHTFTPDVKNWATHIASNYPCAAYNRLNDDIIVADTGGSGRDNFYYVKYSNTASSRVELHGWSSNLQYWISHTATSSGSF